MRYRLAALVLLSAAGVPSIRTDSRLNGQSAMAPEVRSVEVAVRHIGRTANFPVWDPDDEDEPRRGVGRLLLQAGLKDRKILVSWEKKPGAEALEAVAAAVGAEWRPFASHWVLTDSPGLERIVTLSTAQRMDEAGRLGSPLSELTPQQVAALQSGRHLTPPDLTPAQRQILAARAMYDYAGGAPRERLGLEGIRIALERVPREPGANSAVDDSVVVLVQIPDGSWATAVSRGIGHIRVGNAQLTPVKRLQLPRLAEVAGPPGKPAALRDDPAFSQPLLVPKATNAWAVLIAAAPALQVELAAAPAIGERPLPNLPVGTASAVLEAVAERTGSKWRKVGATYVLWSPPSLVRAAALHPTARSLRIRESLATVLANLSRAQKDELFRSRALHPSRLTPSQRRWLSGAMEVAFVGETELSSGVLRLEACRITYGRSDAQSPVVRLLAEAFDGNEFQIAELPIERR